MNSEYRRSKQRVILNDLAEVVYAPQRIFKKIVENPKYWAILIIFILFIGLQIGYEYVQFSKTYTEQTSPTVDQLFTYTNATLWNAGSGVNLTNNYNDFFNYSVYVAALGAATTSNQSYYPIFGNSSLEMDASNTNNLTAALGNAFNVDCQPTGFQNLSMTIKQVQPTTAPKNAVLTLYSLNDSNSYSWDLTSSLSNSTAIGLWNNLTIPVGPSAQGWTAAGAPNWGNITALQLSLSYPVNANITIRIGALFFGGEYQTPLQYNNSGLLYQFLEVFSLQFVFSWLLLTGIMYLLFKGLKTTLAWKPLFVALGFALFVMVIRAIINLVAAATLPTVYFPYDVSLGVRFDAYMAIYFPPEAASALTAQSQAIFNSINSMTQGFHLVTTAMFAVSYVWLGALCSIIVGALKPEFSLTKRIIISAVTVGATILLLLLFVGVV